MKTFKRKQRRTNRKGMSTIELVMALGVLFTAAWSMLELGGVACQAYIKYVSYTVLWALL